ncbi:Hsp70 family protein [Dactylosporangium sp. AC04546]|uniref:Hsp70 family protein n=1 Tax=Dactylosporangium sp. AC04546 TaxID=2862460 RepID=UPI002E7C4617|nr:Hsp70 family protein [Dactylosporangium sp. AC04546]WVK80179.1 Hsp70 family protein [Dactylosporangium sp. AC04546]
MDVRGYRLGVDFGTSNTVAMLAWPDGHVRPLLFDGSPTLPSSVYDDPGNGLLVGRDAVHAARISPERFEPNPKRRIDESAVLLGERERPTADLIAAVLARVAGEARRVSGGQLGPVTVTCPAAWAQTRRGVLLAAAERAGLGAVTLVPEPVAAAHVFWTMVGDAAPPGSAFLVYDLGAGTFDASVVRHGAGAFTVLATEGLSTSGGLDIDAAIVGYLGAAHAGREPAAWNRLVHPTTSAERRASRMLWDDVRAAKEMLSRTAATMIHLPAYDTDVPLGRDQFEQLARPILTATVTASRAAVATAGLTPADIAGVFLVGGGSRIPLVATLLHQALGIAPTVVEQPELVVAQGAVGAANLSGPTPPAAPPFSAPPAPASAPPFSAPPAPASGPPSYAFPASAPPFSAPPAPASGPPSYVSPASAPPAPVSGAAAVPPPPPARASASVSGAPYPTSAVPSSPGPHLANAPVSPGFAAAPVTGYPASPPPGTYQPPPPPRPAPPVFPPTVAAAGPAPVAGKRRNPALLVGLLVVVLAVAGAGVYGALRLFNTDDNGNGGGGDGGQSSVTADLEYPDVRWDSNAEEFAGSPGKKIGYACPADGTIITVWGSGPYTTDSSVCTAAVHAGQITLAAGGHVVIEISAGASSYEGSLQHDISTQGYDSYPSSFDFVG